MNKFTKVGKTYQDELKRFNNYPKGLQLHLHISCLNSVEVERFIITEFNNLFQNVKLYGKYVIMMMEDVVDDDVWMTTKRKK